jgi:hypothetical protein
MNTQPFDQSFKLLKNSYKIGVAALLSLAFLIASTMPVLASPQVTFTGTNLGDIPDGTGVQPQCQTPGPPRDVTFNVTGLTGNVQTVTISLTIEHPWVGDVLAILIAPGGTRQLDLFGYTGATVGPGTNPSAGDSSDLGAQYTFSDAATASWWATATATTVGPETLIPGGAYRTSQRGGAGSTGANTSLNATFGGLTPAQANGTWTLRVTDGCASDTGTVTAAALDITTATTPPVAAKPFFDYFGSGKSSFGVYNNTGANVIWRVLNNGGAGQETIFWGLGTNGGTTSGDVLTPGYFDADNRADIGVWRPSTTAGESRFFIRNTNPVTLNAFPFGSFVSANVGDFAGYDADYDGDGRDDPTTIRVVNGQWLWSYRASSTNTLRSVAFGSPSTDFPFAGGDFTGDGRADLVVLRINDNGPETYIWGDSVSGQQISSFIWGEFNTDYYVIGDFLGDSRIDFAVWRGAGAGTDANWYIRENGGAGFVARNFGVPRVAGTGGAPSTGDLAIAGDFGGDSKYDIAVYRQSNNTFYWLNTPTATTVSGQQFGLAGDRPVGELRTY